MMPYRGIAIDVGDRPLVVVRLPIGRSGDLVGLSPCAATGISDSVSVPLRLG